ncbi:MAG: menaquinone biosynthesis protein [Acidobacteria bacterium]|nr:menaquinone biosynthesis protein [Acidobacteriota bacterium]
MGMKPRRPGRPQRERPHPRPPKPLGPLRVSVVRYLNTAPLVWGLERGPARKRYRLHYTLPAGCSEELRTGRADVGIIPAIDYQTIPRLKIIPGIAIASERRVESVLLVSRGPARRARRVALDASSRTSAALVKILFARHWGREPDYVEAAPNLAAMLAQADAALLIGDPALQFALHSPAAATTGLNKENLHVYDLAEEWNRLTNLPLVFALWAARGERLREPEARRRLVRDFKQSRDDGLAHLEEIARVAAQRLALPGGQLRRYLRASIDYRLDAPHQAGLESFFRYAKELGLIEEVRPLEFL